MGGIRSRFYDCNGWFFRLRFLGKIGFILLFKAASFRVTISDLASAIFKQWTF